MGKHSRRKRSRSLSVESASRRPKDDDQHDEAAAATTSHNNHPAAVRSSSLPPPTSRTATTVSSEKKKKKKKSKKKASAGQDDDEEEESHPQIPSNFDQRYGGDAATPLSDNDVPLNGPSAQNEEPQQQQQPQNEPRPASAPKTEKDLKKGDVKKSKEKNTDVTTTTTSAASNSKTSDTNQAVVASPSIVPQSSRNDTRSADEESSSAAAAAGVRKPRSRSQSVGDSQASDSDPQRHHSNQKRSSSLSPTKKEAKAKQHDRHRKRSASFGGGENEKDNNNNRKKDHMEPTVPPADMDDPNATSEMPMPSIQREGANANQAMEDAKHEKVEKSNKNDETASASKKKAKKKRKMSDVSMDQSVDSRQSRTKATQATAADASLSSKRSESAVGAKTNTALSKVKRPLQDRGDDDNDITAGDDAADTSDDDAGLKVGDNDDNDDDDDDDHLMKPAPKVKPPPVLDVVVHRMRHLNWIPHSILTMRSTPQHCPHRYLAVARENGSVELRSVQEKFRTLCTVGGHTHTLVHALAWIKDYSRKDDDNDNHKNVPATLVGASPNGSLFVVDFQSLRLEHVTPSGGGGIFVLESLYEKGLEQNDEVASQSSSLVAAGCEDGAVRVFQYSSENGFTLFSTVPTMSAPVMSLAWRRMESPKNSATESNRDCLVGTCLFAGVTDGTIRMYTYQQQQPHHFSSRRGASITARWKPGHRMTVESLGRKVPTRIWTLKLLADWTVISSDSLGNVQFWDGQTGSLYQSFQQTDLKSDVLDLAVSSNECKVFASGVDSRIVCLERPALSQPQSLLDNSNDDKYKDRRWILSHAQRSHSHDVTSLAICFRDAEEDEGGARGKPKPSENYAMELLCSGGVDMKLCTYGVSSFHSKRPRTIYPWPVQSPILVAKQARILAVVRHASAQVYQIEDSHLSEGGRKILEAIPVSDERSLLGTIEMQTQSNLTCGALSNHGKFLVLCDSYSVYVFHLKYNKKNGDFSPLRIAFHDQPAVAVVTASFLPDNSTLLLALSNGNILHLEINFASDVGDSYVIQKRQTISLGEGEEKDFSPSMRGRLSARSFVTTSSGQWLASLCSSPGKCAVHIHKREKNGLYRHSWTLPKLTSAITAISFVGTGEEDAPRLAVACLKFELYIFDIVQRHLDPWSRSVEPLDRDENAATDRALAMGVYHRVDYPRRLCTHSSFSGKLLMGARGVFVLIDLTQPPPRRCRAAPERYGRRRNKRKRSLSQSSVGDKEHDPKQQQEPKTLVPESVQCVRYKSMLYMDFIADNEMIVVEQPWLDVVATFPDALQRKIYGT
ncbi:hypothetical protein ACA910_014092 [Epithemia clementina (nom. ined.)]